MRILVINPNTTTSMTEKISEAANNAAASYTQIIAVNPIDGPVSIEGYYDEAYCVPGLLSEIRKGELNKIDAHIIACFDDTGLESARSLARAPVIGIGEAAFHVASLLGHRFSVITTLSRSIAAIENNLMKYGLASRCARVRASDIPVLELEDPTSQAYVQISEQIELAKRVDQAEVIVLGCAGMADLAHRLSIQYSIPVIDGVAAAVKFGEGLCGLGLKTSKLGAYGTPLPKGYKGQFGHAAPD
mgnify:CR=1 FL=1